MDAIVRLTQEIGKLWRAVRKLQVTGFQRPVWLATPLTSTAWDGDSFSTTAKTLIDLSAVFGAPANIKAVYLLVAVRDSASGGADALIILSPNNTSLSGLIANCSGATNDIYQRTALIVPCDANGDIYYQTFATGASTLDVGIEIWAYWL